MTSNSELANSQSGGNHILAAFRLGLLGYTTSGIWVDLFREMPDWEAGTGDGVLLAIQQLEEALVTLAHEIPVNVYNELRPLLLKLKDDWRPVVREIYMAEDAARAPDFIWSPIPRNEDLVAMRILTGQAILGDSPYWGWLRLGAAIGAYQVAHRHHSAGRELSDLQRVVEAARLLTSENSLFQVDELTRLVRLASAKRPGSPRNLLERSLGKESDNEPVPDEGLALNFLIQELESRIQFALQIMFRLWQQSGARPNGKEIRYNHSARTTDEAGGDGRGRQVDGIRGRYEAANQAASRCDGRGSHSIRLHQPDDLYLQSQQLLLERT